MKNTTSKFSFIAFKTKGVKKSTFSQRKKLVLIVTFAGILFSCNNVKKDEKRNLIHASQKYSDSYTKEQILLQNSALKTENSLNNENANSYSGAEHWIKKSIENEFNNGEGSLEKLCTKQYAEFKADAMGTALDYDITDGEFKKKWQGKYNVNLVNQEGFLLGTQDYAKITVSAAIPKKIEDNGAWYSVTIKDDELNYTVERNIRIIKSGTGFLIDEVLEDGFSNN